MKIVLTGGGTGGHFYPLIAVANEIYKVADELKIIEPSLYYIGTDPYDTLSLEEQNITFIQAPSGKVRKYFSIKNITDPFKVLFGTIKAVWILFTLYPDIILSKGGYVSVPTLIAARFLRIPVIVHESDARPGKANLLGAKFARWVAISYPGSAKYFPNTPKEKIALTGNPVRESITKPVKEGAHTYLNLRDDMPTIFIIGGSLGAKAINRAVLDALPKLISKYQIIHQVGPKNLKYVTDIAHVILENNPYSDRYRAFDFLDSLALRMAAGAADLIIMRAGSGSIFEAASWGLPAIVIPIPEDVSHDQVHNALTYASTGAATIIEQENLEDSILINEIDRILSDKLLMDKMSKAAKGFSKPNAARKIAEVMIKTALEHEK
jgi:UDP-N-acetylglucosamine--N-acetylmuramyl-(pentapeptide) pyrophosphoryl-undecaprenol N-acetylglucosamine transferase